MDQIHQHVRTTPGCVGAVWPCLAKQRCRRRRCARAAVKASAASAASPRTVIERRACDILVIGDSPEGCLAAYSAAKAGRKVRFACCEEVARMAFLVQALGDHCSLRAAALYSLKQPHSQVILLPSFGLQAASPAHQAVLQPLKV